MKTFYLLTPWLTTSLLEETGGKTAFVPQVQQDYPGIQRCSLYSRQDNLPPNPNISMVRVVCSDSLYEQITKDEKYAVVSVAGEEAESMSLSESQSLKAYLEGKGVSSKDADTFLAETNKKSCAEALTAWLKVRPKAVQIEP